MDSAKGEIKPVSVGLSVPGSGRSEKKFSSFVCDLSFRNKRYCRRLCTVVSLIARKDQVNWTELCY